MFGIPVTFIPLMYDQGHVAIRGVGIHCKSRQLLIIGH